MPKFFTTLEKVKPVYDVTYKVVMVICKLLLIADILITSMAVAGRYISFIPDPAWSEQVVLTLMAYMAVLSAALAIRRGAHIRMTAFDRYLPKKVINASNLLADIAVLVLAGVMLYFGWTQASNIGRFGKYETLPWLSRFWKYFPVPLAGIAMIVFELEAIFNDIKAFFVKDDPEKKEAVK